MTSVLRPPRRRRWPAGRWPVGRWPAGRGRDGSGWWLVVAVLLLVAAAFFAAAVRDRPGRDPASTPEPAATEALATALPAPAETPARSQSLGPLVARVPPVGLRIPALGLAVRLSELGLNPDRTVEVPTDFQRPGWFRLGPAPGQPGSAVILGHVDSYRGPAVFFRLRSLRAGDRVEVELADGGVARFAVRAVQTYPKRAFPAGQVYGSHGDRALQLVTCGGEFDRRARSYLSNVVVYTELVSAVPAPAARASAAPAAPAR